MCHAGTDPNGGPGDITVLIGGMPVHEYAYTPGETVPVEVAVSDPDASQTVRGFALSVRSPEGCFQAGELATIEGDEGVRFQTGGRNTPAPCPASPLQQATHTAPRAAEDGVARFLFNWTAPAANAGPIVFAAAGNAANGDSGRMGDRIYLTSAVVLPADNNVVSSASGRGPTFSPGQIVSFFGENLTQRGITSAGEQATMRPLPTTLAGLSASVIDSAGEERQMPLLLAVNTQVNGLIPQGSADGLGTLKVSLPLGTVIETPIDVAAVSPGLYTVDGSGSGLAAAVAVRIAPDGARTPVNLIGTSGGEIVPLPLDLSRDGQTVVLLFGTGLRNGSEVRALVNGDPAPVVGAGPSGEFDGLDQVNVLLDPGLAGSGTVSIVVTVDGKPTNAVDVVVQ